MLECREKLNEPLNPIQMKISQITKNVSLKKKIYKIIGATQKIGNIHIISTSNFSDEENICNACGSLKAIYSNFYCDVRQNADASLSKPMSSQDPENHIKLYSWGMNKTKTEGNRYKTQKNDTNRIVLNASLNICRFFFHLNENNYTNTTMKII